jgi:hypothetical protein
MLSCYLDKFSEQKGNRRALAITQEERMDVMMPPPPPARFDENEVAFPSDSVRVGGNGFYDWQTLYVTHERLPHGHDKESTYARPSDVLLFCKRHEGLGEIRLWTKKTRVSSVFAKIVGIAEFRFKACSLLQLYDLESR